MLVEFVNSSQNFIRREDNAYGIEGVYSTFLGRSRFCLEISD